MLNNLPKPVLVGVSIVLILLAVVVLFRTATGKGENEGRLTQEETIKAQQGGQRTAPTNVPQGGRQSPSSGR